MAEWEGSITDRSITEGSIPGPKGDAQHTLRRHRTGFGGKVAVESVIFLRGYYVGVSGLRRESHFFVFPRIDRHGGKDTHLEISTSLLESV